MRSLWLIPLLFLPLALRAGGEKFQINFILSPSAEWLRFSNSPTAARYNSLYGTKLSYSAGLEYKRFFDPSLSLSVGVCYFNKGFRNVDKISGANTITLYSNHIASVPVALNFHHQLKRRIEMIYSFGVVGGYSMMERVRNGIYSGEEAPEEGLFTLADGNGNIDLFHDLYVAGQVGVGISAYLKSRVVLVVQPTYRLQLNNAHDYYGIFFRGDPVVMHLNSFGVDLKLGYFFTKQVRNRKKDL